VFLLFEKIQYFTGSVLSSESYNSNYNVKSSNEIREAIAKSGNIPTITITVGRMMTGVSVPHWDTIILLSGGESIQRRIQTYGRVGTPYVVKEQLSEEELRENPDKKPHKICKNLTL
jgi:superfamily II DNA or RNA helicase